MAILPKEVQKKRCCCCTLPSRPSQAFVSGVRLPSFSPAGFALPTGVLKLIPVAASANSPPQPGRPAIASQPPPPRNFTVTIKSTRIANPNQKWCSNQITLNESLCIPALEHKPFSDLSRNWAHSPSGTALLCSVLRDPK